MTSDFIYSWLCFVVRNTTRELEPSKSQTRCIHCGVERTRFQRYMKCRLWSFWVAEIFHWKLLIIDYANNLMDRRHFKPLEAPQCRRNAGARIRISLALDSQWLKLNGHAILIYPNLMLSHHYSKLKYGQREYAHIFEYETARTKQSWASFSSCNMSWLVIPCYTKNGGSTRQTWINWMQI